MVKSCMYMFIMVAAVVVGVSDWDGNGCKVVAEAQQVSGMFVFGDSLIDCGNNNYLSSIAKANYVPYGIDFNGGPTGRFCNGKTIVDFLGDFLGLPVIPPFVTTPVNVLRGVNYASAAAGILDESGQQLGQRFSLRQQIQNFRITLVQLRSKMDEKEYRKYLAKALVVSNLGSNDYLNNYLMPTLYSSSFNYNPNAYADLLIDQYANNLMELYNLGIRKFLLAAVGPLGCIPYQLAAGLAPPGKCVGYVNDMVQLFNSKLYSLVGKLNANHKDAIFVFGDSYKAFMGILQYPASYGFTVTDKGCCGIGRNRGQITCLPLSIPCSDRDHWIFWDAYHPSQAFNKIIAEKAYRDGSTFCYPMSVQQLANV